MGLTYDNELGIRQSSVIDRFAEGEDHIFKQDPVIGCYMLEQPNKVSDVR